MATKTLKQIRAEVEKLGAEHIDSESRTVNWSDLMGENMDGWRSYEAVTCGECNKTVCVVGPWRSYKAVTCGECNKTVCVVGPQGECRHNDVDQDTECSGYINSEGPMMNYFYPCDVGQAPVAAALAVSGCICVVEMDDGTTGFALTGGGMDLSWDIAAAYVDNGFLPPAWIRLPRMGGKALNARTRLIIEACKRTAELMAQRARWNVGDLEILEKWMRSEARKKAA